MTSVLVLTPDFPPAPGGIQLLMGNLVNHLRDLEPQVVTLNAQGADGLDPHYVRRIASKTAKGNRLAVARLNAAGVTQGLRQRPDVVVSGHAVTAPAALLLRRALRCAVIQYAHADEFRQRPGFARMAVRGADAIVAVSRHTRGLALAAGCEPERLHVVHPGVDPPGIVEAAPAERPTIITVARLAERYKGHDLMIKAMPHVRAEVPDCQWVVIGDGPLRSWLEELAASHGVADCVRFLGRVHDEERESWLACAHVFAMPSRLPKGGTGGEGFGIVYLEAGTHQLPVVAGKVGGALDAVVDGETGLLVDPTDELALADALVELLSNRSRATELGRAGAERARTLTWRRHADAVRELMERVAGTP